MSYPTPYPMMPQPQQPMMPQQQRQAGFPHMPPQQQPQTQMMPPNSSGGFPPMPPQAQPMMPPTFGAQMPPGGGFPSGPPQPQPQQPMMPQQQGQPGFPPMQPQQQPMMPQQQGQAGFPPMQPQQQPMMPQQQGQAGFPPMQPQQQQPMMPQQQGQAGFPPMPQPQQPMMPQQPGQAGFPHMPPQQQPQMMPPNSSGGFPPMPPQAQPMMPPTFGAQMPPGGGFPSGPPQPQPQQPMMPQQQGQPGFPPMQPQQQPQMMPQQQGQPGFPPIPPQQQPMMPQQQGQAGFPPMPPQQQQPQMMSPNSSGGFPPMPPQAQPMMPPTFGAGGAQMPPGAGGGFPPGPPQPQRQRLDPDMMPSIVQVMEDDRNSRSGLFPTGFPQAELPPLITTEFIAQDQGNSNPKFMRSTIYAVPQNSDMTKATHIPLSLAITPFAKLNSSEYPPPMIDLGDIGPVRCQRCKAYMCPFMEFIDGGRKFRCPFCKASSAIEDAYFAHLDHTGRRTDIQHRPELFLGSYEFVATKQYCKNGTSPKQPAFIFMLDVSYNAVRNGLVELFCRNITELLRDLPRENFHEKSTMRIGLATYDQSVHFYNLSQPEHAEMLVVNDIADIFVPFVDGFLVEFEQAEKALTCCLREIVNNFSSTRITETTLGPVIQAGLDALRSADRTGKLFIFHTSLPTLEAPGQLKNREDRKVLGTDKEKTMLTAASEFYGKLGEECVKCGCAIDLFLFPNSFVDVASIAPAVCSTGGTIYKYQYFDAERDGTRFLADLRHDIGREVVFDVMLRLRTSTGIRPTGFYGNFFMQNTTDIEVSTLDCDKSVQVEIKYDDKLEEREAAYFQVAVLFTSCGGQRRLRIHNVCEEIPLSLPVTADYSQLYRLVDEDCLVAHLFKQAEQLVREKSPKEMRDELTLRCAQVLAAYREKCSESAPMGQLILPELAKLLPLHANCILRHDSLNGGPELTVDDRAWMMSLVPSMTPLAVSQFLYPRIYPLTTLGSTSIDANGEENGGGLTMSGGGQKGKGTIMAPSSVEMPAPIRASFDYFGTEEAYLIENGLVAFIWCGAGVPKEWLQSVFNVASVAHLDTEKHELPERDNAHSRALRQLWAAVNADRERHLKLFLVKEQDALESWMKKFLVEDRYSNIAHSYVDFLCLIHREIRSILT